MTRTICYKVSIILIFCGLIFNSSGCGSKDSKKEDAAVSETQGENKPVIEDGTTTGEPSFSFKNIPAGGVEASGIFKLEVEIKNFPPDVVWNAGATPRKESTASSEVGFVLFDQAVDAKTVNFDTFLVEKNAGNYYLFVVMIYPSGFSKTFYSEGQLKINNTGVPRIENPVFFTDALGANRNRLLTNINTQECCVFLQDAATDTDGKVVTFDVPLSADPFQYNLDLMTANTTVAANVLGDFTIVDDAPNELRHVTVRWQPTGLAKAANYRLRLRVLNTASAKEASIESTEFGLYADNEIPLFSSLIASGGVLEANCSSCHTVANNREFIWNDHASFATWDVRGDNQGISHRALIRTAMQAGYMPQNGALTAAHKLDLQLYMKAASPAPAAP